MQLRFYEPNLRIMNKTEQLIDAIDHPENYSDEELHALLSDPEVKEVYSTMCSMRAALSPLSKSDIDLEWETFVKSKKSIGFFGVQLRYTKILLRNSAAVVAVCLLSAAAIATVIGVKLHERQAAPVSYSEDATELVEVATVMNEQDTSAIKPATPEKYEPVLFENRPLEEILNTIKGHYEVEVRFKSQEAKKLRLYFNWNPELPVTDIVDLLNNFQQFSIRLSDNTLVVE